jgi:hypothetical protein
LRPKRAVKPLYDETFGIFSSEGNICNCFYTVKYFKAFQIYRSLSLHFNYKFDTLTYEKIIFCKCDSRPLRWSDSSSEECLRIRNFFKIGIVGGGVQLGPLGSEVTNRPIVPAPGDYDDGEIGGMIGRGNRSTRRKPAPMPLCPIQTPHAARTRTRAAALGSQRLTACYSTAS